jgi:hypothetical protein
LSASNELQLIAEGSLRRLHFTHAQGNDEGESKLEERLVERVKRAATHCRRIVETTALHTRTCEIGGANLLSTHTHTQTHTHTHTHTHTRADKKATRKRHKVERRGGEGEESSDRRRKGHKKDTIGKGERGKGEERRGRKKSSDL